MANKSYSDKLKDPRWQKKRLQIMARDKWRCRLCGDEDTPLHVHHKEYISGNDPWEYDNSYLVTLCEHCHTEISGEEYNDIPFNNLRILKCNNWQGGSRIMFVTSMNGTCSMVIYDDDGKFICGYNLNQDTQDIIKILKVSKRHE